MFGLGKVKKLLEMFKTQAKTELSPVGEAVRNLHLTTLNLLIQQLTQTSGISEIHETTSIIKPLLENGLNSLDEESLSNLTRGIIEYSEHLKIVIANEQAKIEDKVLSSPLLLENGHS